MRFQTQPRKDSRGVVLRPDQLVAYNLSGDVVLGRVAEIKPSYVLIDRVDQGTYYVRKPSRVKNARSICVLTEPGGSIPLPVAPERR